MTRETAKDWTAEIWHLPGLYLRPFEAEGDSFRKPCLVSRPLNEDGRHIYKDGREDPLMIDSFRAFAQGDFAHFILSTQGCPNRCPWCCQPQTQEIRKPDRDFMSLLPEILEKSEGKAPKSMLVTGGAFKQGVESGQPKTNPRITPLLFA